MAAKKFIFELDAAERVRLKALISKGAAPAKAILKARILLQADVAEGGPGWLDARIAEALATNLTMVSHVREKFVTRGLDAVLAHRSAGPAMLARRSPHGSRVATATTPRPTGTSQPPKPA